MIRVNVFKDSDGNCRGIQLKGHAGYDDYGRDIICASVSALALNMANSVEQFTDDGFDGSVEEESGAFEFSFKLLMDSLILGLRNIAETYGEQYIKIRFEEV